MKDLIYLGKIVAFLSFIIGTTTLSLYLYFDNSNSIGSFGFYFVIIALVINMLLLVVNIIAIAIDSQHRSELIKTSGIMLLNIPIAVVYFYIVISITLSSVNPNW
ncbi:hypothetical protein [Hwangdonia sp.]|uniref:hypothetical protein n=1 Tax=Hwangdonia sp. TaxID=1883432 RepID=UPI003AB1C987